MNWVIDGKSTEDGLGKNIDTTGSDNDRCYESAPISIW